MRRLPAAGAVVFDLDSTLAAVEGIELLAGGHREEVERLTRDAMEGVVPLEQVYGRRLDLVRPCRRDLDTLGGRYVAALVPDAKEVVAALHAEGIEVRIVSGGLRLAAMVAAAELGIQPGKVEAVEVFFDERGDYAGFDTTSPLARSGGKADVLRRWRPELRAPVMLVGDGVTDLEARTAADVFVAYAGVVERPAVVAAADVVVRSRSLAPVLALALGGEPPSAASARSLFDKGLGMLEAEYRTCLSRAESRES